MNKVEKIKQLFGLLSDRDKKEVIKFINNEVQVENGRTSRGIFVGPVPATEDVCEKCGKPLAP